MTKPTRGVIDLVLDDRSSPVYVAAEAQSELRRLEQQVRWSNEKAEGLRERITDDDPASIGAVISRLLILRSTVSTRELDRRFEVTLATAYPAAAEDVFEALTTPSAPWPGAGIIWVRVVGARATVLDAPPRGVAIGRRRSAKSATVSRRNAIERVDPEAVITNGRPRVAHRLAGLGDRIVRH